MNSCIIRPTKCPKCGSTDIIWYDMVSILCFNCKTETPNEELEK